LTSVLAGKRKTINSEFPHSISFKAFSSHIFIVLPYGGLTKHRLPHAIFSPSKDGSLS